MNYAVVGKHPRTGQLTLVTYYHADGRWHTHMRPVSTDIEVLELLQKLHVLELEPGDRGPLEVGGEILLTSVTITARY